MKSFVKQLHSKGGIAAAIGRYYSDGAFQKCYVRYMNCGKLAALTRSLCERKFYSERTIPDCVLSTSDLRRLAASNTAQRSTIKQDIKTSFDKFVSSCSSQPLFAFICMAGSKGDVVTHTFGLDDGRQTALRLCIEEQLRNPKAEEELFTHKMVTASSSDLPPSAQYAILNAIPAQCFQQRKCESSLGIALSFAWPAAAPKHLIIQSNVAIPLILRSYFDTEGKSLQPRAPSSTASRKRKRHCSRHHLFLRHFAEATSACKDTAKRALGISTQNFRAELSNVQLFQSSLTKTGYARILKFSESEFEIVWNKFDPIKSK
jgi:hypothetical protein